MSAPTAPRSMLEALSAHLWRAGLGGAAVIVDTTLARHDTEVKDRARRRFMESLPEIRAGIEARRGASGDRLTDEQLQALRREAVSEGKESLVAACDDAAFSGCAEAMARCALAVRMRRLQAGGAL